MIYRIFLLLPISIIIPLIIHILSRRRIKEEFFPSLLFLLEREKRLRNYIKFEELLLFILRVLMIISLTLAGGMLFIPFKFFNGGKIRKIYDTSLSMEGRIAKKGYETVNVNEIADFEKTFDKYKYGIIVSDMQEINFESILKKNKKYRYFIPEIVGLPDENNSIVDVDYILDNGVKIFVKIIRIGKRKNEELILYFDDRKFTKNILLNEGENVIEFFINEKIKGYHKIKAMIKDELIFDNVFYKVIFSQEFKIKILSDEEPEFLIKALKRRFFIERIKDLKEIEKNDIVIIENIRNFINIDYLSRICSKIILSLCDSIKISGIKIKRINDKYGNIFDEEMNIITEEPLKYNYIIEGGEKITSFTNNETAIVRNKNIIITAFPLQAEELVYHTYYIPFLYSIIEKSITDIEINKQIGDTLKGDFEKVITPDSLTFFNLKEIICEKRGFYQVVKEGESIFVSVNPRKEEYNMKILEKEKMHYILGRTKLYDGTGFFILIFLFLLIIEKFMERR